jgi:hypothetical protein
MSESERAGDGGGGPQPTAREREAHENRKHAEIERLRQWVVR